MFSRAYSMAREIVGFKLLSRTGRGSECPLIDRSSRIPGWLFPGEPEFILDCVERSPRGDFIEIGSLYGKSSSLICGGIQKRGFKETLYACDPFYNLESINLTAHVGGGHSTFPGFVKNAVKYGYYDTVVPLATFSNRIIPKLNIELGFAFIDGMHTYEAAKEDLLLVLPKLKPGAIVLFHDAIGGDYPGVLQAIDEVVAENPNFTRRGTAGSIVALDYKAAAARAAA